MSFVTSRYLSQALEHAYFKRQASRSSKQKENYELTQKMQALCTKQ